MILQIENAIRYPRRELSHVVQTPDRELELESCWPADDSPVIFTRVPCPVYEHLEIRLAEEHALDVFAELLAGWVNEFYQALGNGKTVKARDLHYSSLMRSVQAPVFEVTLRRDRRAIYVYVPPLYGKGERDFKSDHLMVENRIDDVALRYILEQPRSIR